MPSVRRVRVAVLLVVTVLIVIIYHSHHSSTVGDSSRQRGEFYSKTVQALGKDRESPPGTGGGDGGQTVMDAGGGGGGGGGGAGEAAAEQATTDRDGDGDLDEKDDELRQDTHDRLKAAEQKAKDLANQKALKPDRPEEVIGVGSSAEGQSKEDPESGDTKTEGEVRAENAFNAILKRAPVIIFSKTYCPFSKKAKALLLETYEIEPEPHVVELDKHEDGPALQDLLEKTTKRRTVPNILVNTISLGGSDELAAMEAEGKLVEKVTYYGDKKVTITKRNS